MFKVQGLCLALTWFLGCVFVGVCGLCSGAAAGALASLITNPLDIVKLRLQGWLVAVEKG